LVLVVIGAVEEFETGTVTVVGMFEVEVVVGRLTLAVLQVSESL